MQRPRRIAFGLRLALGVGLLLPLLAPPPASAGGHRLYRHRSGYLYGASKPYHSQSPYYDPYGFGYRGNGRGDHVDYARRDFDSRRDRLLDQASRIDVSYVNTSTGSAPVRTIPINDGWVFLGEGKPVDALGAFTARIMRAPGDGQARVGFALAAAMLDDDRAAAHSMRTAIRFDPQVLQNFAADETLDKMIRGLLARLQPEDAEPTITPTTPTRDIRFLMAAMRGLLHEYDAALVVLDDMGVDDRDRSSEALCSMLEEGAASTRPEVILVSDTHALTASETRTRLAPTSPPRR